MLRIACLLAFSTLILTSCGMEERQKPLPYFNTPDFTPHFIKTQTEVDKTITHTIDAFSFRNQRGEAITDNVISDKIHVANFIFTSCGSICPVMTNHMKLVNDVFGNDSGVVMLSYSVTPWIDDVAQLKSYTDRNAIATSNWHFLTGKKSEIYSLARQSYFAEEDLGFTRDSTEFLHTEHFILVDQNKRIRGIYNGTLELDIRQLIDDIKVLKATE
jgi:protein SCO1